jgi:uncharacterized membrane protein
MKFGKAILPFILVATLMAGQKAYPSDSQDYYCSIDKSDHGRQPMHEFWQKLPEEKRQLLHNMMINAEKQNEALKTESKRLITELNGLLTAATFNKSAYQSKSAKLGVLQAKIKANWSDAFTEIAGQFNRQEREILAKMNEIRHHRLLDDESYCTNHIKGQQGQNDPAKKYTH